MAVISGLNATLIALHLRDSLIVFFLFLLRLLLLLRHGIVQVNEVNNVTPL